MQFSLPEKVSQTSITLMKVNPEQDLKRIKVEQNKCIKINRKKLPSDFFRVSIEKKLKKKSSVDLCSNKINNQITFFQIKQPQTQRKVHSYKFLSNSETNPSSRLNSGRWTAFKVQDGQQKILQRKLLEKQTFATKSVEKISRVEKSVDLTKLKPPKLKNSQQKIKNMDNFQKKVVKHSTEMIEKGQATQFVNFIDLGCTFGCGFNNKVSFNLVNYCVQQQNPLLNPYQHVGESTSQDSPTKINNKRLYKSTEFKELEDLKHKQNSPIKETNKRKIFPITEESHQFDRSKISPIQKNIINQDLILFDNLCLEDPKIVLAGTNDQKPLNLRKDKRNDNMNLPKIENEMLKTQKRWNS